MKSALLVLSLFSCMTLMAGKTVKLTIKWAFENVQEGYDHENKMLVYIDGKSVGESSVFQETEKGTYELEVPKGKHEVKIHNYSLYEGKWDIHTKANNYSVDAFYEGTINMTANTTVNMVFDINSETTDVKITGGSEAKGEGVPLAITWKFTNVEEGYDHQSRMQVYVDGKLAGISDVYLESKQGKMVVYVPTGNHDIVVENYAFYEGQWELHAIKNNYSIDAFYSINMLFSKKKRSMNLIFDIETLETTVTVK